MKIIIPLVFLSCLGCQQGEQIAAPDVEADIQAIKDSIVELEAAANTGDVDRVMALFTDDAVVIRPNEPALIGKEARRNHIQQEFDELEFQEVYEVKNVDVSGDLAVAHITWSSTITNKSSGKTINPKGNWIRVYKRQSDGAWKCIYSIWSNEDLIHPPLPE